MKNKKARWHEEKSGGIKNEKKKDGKRDKNEWEWFDAERKKKDTKKINRYRNHQNISSFFFIFAETQKKSLSFPFVVLFIFIEV